MSIIIPYIIGEISPFSLILSLRLIQVVQIKIANSFLLLSSIPEYGCVSVLNPLFPEGHLDITNKAFV